MTAQPSLFSGRGGARVMPARAVRELSKADPALGEIISQVGPFKIDGDDVRHPVATLARAITGQQLSGRVAQVIYGRLEQLLGKVGAEQILASDRETLRKVGLSYAKVEALQDLAAKAQAGVVPTAAVLHRLSDDEIVERLTAVRGIGRWTVEMLLMFRLGRPDVLPADDLGIRKGFQKVYRKREMPKPKAILAYGERWRPYRTVASWYLWRSLELEAEVPKGRRSSTG
jgi:DNA-3-methyladenine glycosylase II